MNYSNRGITLIELMVVLVVLAILVSIAYPSYVDHVQRTRRADAMSALTELANRQERFYTQTFNYTNVLGSGGLEYSATSPDGYYTLSVTTPSTSTYTLQADAVGPQTADTGCTTMTLTSAGVKSPANCWRR